MAEVISWLVAVLFIATLLAFVASGGIENDDYD
jgi:hypothetical protein